MNNHKKFKRQHYNTDKDDNNSSSSFGFEADDKSMEMIGDADNVNELKLKMTALESKNGRLEAKVKMLEEKLASQKVQLELNAKNDAVALELDMVREQNKALGEKLKETEQKAEVAKNEFENMFQESRQKLDSLTKEIAKLKEQQQNHNTAINLDQNYLEKTKNSPCLHLLPLETWVDVLAFVPRHQLGRTVPQIGDRHFAPKAQYYLHEWGQITLCRFKIKSNGRNGPAIVKVYAPHQPNRYSYLPLADVPLPGNVKNFRKINLRNLNQDVLAFLHEFQRNSLFTNVHLNLRNTNAILTFLTHVRPLITSINSIDLGDHGCKDAIRLFKFEYAELAKRMLGSDRVLYCRHKSVDHDFYLDWLYTPINDTHPRILLLTCYMLDTSPCSPFIEQLKQDFLSAKQPTSFIIHLKTFREGRNVQPISLANVETNEKFVVQRKGKPNDGYVTILRHPNGTNEDEWIEEMNKCRASSPNFRTITIEF